jgi:Tol biopolymer transport system component
MLWIRSLEALEARPLAGTEGIDGAFFWSPDGRSIAFTVPGELRRLSLSDGTVDRICSLPVRADDGRWHESGTIYLSVGGLAAVIQSVPASGGEAKILTRLDTEGGERHHHFVQLLPNGERFLFAQSGSREDVTGLFAASLRNPDERRRIAPGLNRWLYSQGQLLVVRDGTLLAQPFDADRLKTTGDPVAIASSVASWSLAPDVGWFDASPAGTLAYFSGDSVSDEVQLAWVDREGRQLGTLGAPGRYGQIALSPDERSVALEISEQEGSYDIWVMDVTRGVTSRVTATPGAERDPVWSPDSRSLAFVARRAEGVDLRRKGLGLSDPETVLADSPDDDIPESWSRDGELLTVRRTAADEQSVWALPLDSGEEARPILATGFRVDEPQVSPDGRWLAYVSPESGRDEVYLQPFRGEGDRVRISAEGGGQPKWRRDGRELFYTEPSGLLMAVEIRSQGGRLEVSPPSELFEVPILQGTGYDDYAVASDGRRFLVKLRLEEDREHRLHIITDWTSLLE